MSYARRLRVAYKLEIRGNGREREKEREAGQGRKEGSNNRKGAKERDCVTKQTRFGELLRTVIDGLTFFRDRGRFVIAATYTEVVDPRASGMHARRARATTH